MRRMLGLLAFLVAATPVQAQAPSVADLARRTVERRAVEAAIWGMPLVSVDAMRQAFFRDAGARYGDILYWSKPTDWKFQFTTPNASTHYVYFNFNLKDGPVVLDVPPVVGAGLFGSILDAWQVPLVDVGPAGEDQGKGGKYLLLPPDFKGDVPDGYIPIRLVTINGYSLLRAIPTTTSEADVAKAIALAKQLRLYPLAQAASPPEQRFIDMADKLIDGVVRFDETFYDALARMVEEEPVLTRDLVAMGQLRSLGIEKGKPFKPADAAMPALRQGAEEAHRGFMEGVRGGQPWWPGTKWKLPESIGAKTGFTFQDANALHVDERGLIFFLAFAAPKKLGAATFYLVGANDGAGEPLQGDQVYRLRVPADVPARQYWAVTVYDLDTACLIRDLSRPGLDSFDRDMRRNADGSVDIYFGPKAPAGQEANWIPTAPGKPWFSLFRFYGPEKPVFDKTWRMTDIERLAR